MKIEEGTVSGNVASMREPLDESLWWYWIAANAAKKKSHGACFKNYHRLSYLCYLCTVQKRRSFFVKYARLVSRLISRRSFIILLGFWSMSDIVSCFGLCVDKSSLDGVLCNSCKTHPVK